MEHTSAVSSSEGMLGRELREAKDVGVSPLVCYGSTSAGVVSCKLRRLTDAKWIWGIRDGFIEVTVADSTKMSGRGGWCIRMGKWGRG